MIYVERVTGIEPALSAWEAEVLPLNYTRTARNPSKTLGSKAAAQTTRSMVFGQTPRVLTAWGFHYRPSEGAGSRNPSVHLTLVIRSPTKAVQAPRSSILEPFPPKRK